jgi:hypothetical protein
VLGVEVEVPREPFGHLVPRLGLRVEAHLLGVGDHRGDVVDVAEAQPPEPESGRLGDDLVERRHGWPVNQVRVISPV